MKKILLTGGKGMLAHDFIHASFQEYKIIALNSTELDITNSNQVKNVIKEIQPDYILNCAAYTAVDDAEGVGSKLNIDINALGVYNLAKISAENNIDFITISSDYVFDGNGENGYNESDHRNPINAYGMAKYLGEKLAVRENKDSIVIRTSWLYGGGGEYKNFVNTMVSLGNKLDSLKVIDDQIGNPTNCKDLSYAILEMLSNIEDHRGSILHFSNSTPENGISWYDFATEIFKQKEISVDLLPCTSANFPTQAKRPHYSKLLNNSTIQLRGRKEALHDYLK